MTPRAALAVAVAAPMRSWWLSWYCPRDMFDAFELHSPWWVTGERMSDDAFTICAAVRAADEAAAWRVILEAYDDPPASVEERFCTEHPDNWSPFCDRFPPRDWMQWPGADTAPGTCDGGGER